MTHLYGPISDSYRIPFCSQNGVEFKRNNFRWYNSFAFYMFVRV